MISSSTVMLTQMDWKGVERENHFLHVKCMISQNCSDRN